MNTASLSNRCVSITVIERGIDEMVNKLGSKLKRKLNVKDVGIPVTFFYSIIRFYYYIWNQCLIDRSVPLSVHCSSSSSLFHCSSSINVTLSYFFSCIHQNIRFSELSDSPLSLCIALLPSIRSVKSLNLDHSLLYSIRTHHFVTRSCPSIVKVAHITSRIIPSLRTIVCIQSSPVESSRIRVCSYSPATKDNLSFPLSPNPVTTFRILESGSTHLQYVSPRVILVRPAECG